MRLKCLKNVLTGLFVVGMSSWLISCPDGFVNPFGNNLGEKVPIEPPTIALISPEAGTFLKGNVTIKMRASAYRQLSDVRIKLGDKISEFESVNPTMSFGDGELQGDVKDKDVLYNFDTKELPDGILIVQFQVSDPDFTVPSVEYKYIIKNNPSTITMTNPDADDLYDTNINGDRTGIRVNPLKDTTGEIYTGTKILGNINDLRGIKPGYPRIQLWKDGDTAPDPTDPNEWAQLFLYNIDDTDTWKYKADSDRAVEQVKNDVTFVLSLSQHTFDTVPDLFTVPTPQNPTPTKKQFKYIVNNDKMDNLVTGLWYFRIKTSDTFFVETKGDPNFMFPANPPLGETEITIREPDVGKWNGPVDYHTIRLLPPTGDSTKIQIDNLDISEEDLKKQPNIYIERESAEKITVAPAERPAGYDPDSLTQRRADFRLRINAFRAIEDGSDLGCATLQWSHPTRGAGFLPWDNNLTGSLGYVSNANMAEQGHKGSPNPKAGGVGKIYQFTGWNGKQFLYYPDWDGKPDSVRGASVTGEVFTGDPRDYTLTVKVYLSLTPSPGGDEETRSYYLGLDDGGPVVEINGIKGQSKGPARDTELVVKEKGGTIDKNEYRVNDNIQVAQYSSATKNIKVEDGKQVIKWFVELADDTDTDGNAHLAKTAILLKELQKYRSNPTSAAAQDFLAYYKSDSTPGTTVLRGVVDQGSFKLSVDTRTSVNPTTGEKIGTNNWNGRYLWLYIVAQDSLYNLGYIMQKLYVDDEGDKPVLTLARLVDTIGDAANGKPGIANTAGLYAGVANGVPVRASANILGIGQGIDLNLSDDDGMRAAAAAGDRLVTITLKSDNFPGVTADVDAVELLGSAEFREGPGSGVLSQSLMARALVARLKALGRQSVVDKLYGEGATVFTVLPDGVYTLDLVIPDALSQKVQGDDTFPLPTPGQAKIEKTIHFAVQSNLPSIDIDDIASAEGTNFLMPGAITITGTVKSRLKIQRLDIAFSPDIVSEDPSAGRSPDETLPLYVNANDTTPITLWSDAVPDANGEYTYYWNKPSVDFGRAGFTAESEERRFELQAWDGMGVPGNERRTVQIDNTPPRVDGLVFNFLREDYAATDINRTWNRVNGKVPIEVEIIDANGVGTFAATDPLVIAGTVAVGDPAIRWFIVPTTNTTFVPAWGTTPAQVTAASTSARSGYFKADDYRGGARYRTIVDTTNGTGGLSLTANTDAATSGYKLYVVARDKAGNAGNNNIVPADPLTHALPATPMEISAGTILRFKVNQSTDNPLLDPTSISPSDGDFVGGTGAVLKIKGSIFDDDGYDSTKATTYVDILFPAGWDDATGAVTNWGTNWRPIGGAETLVDAITGNLNYTYDFSNSATRPMYLSSPGMKYYRLRIRDEAVRSSSGPDSMGAYNPEGKNPDMYKGDGSIRATTPANDLQPAQITLSGTAESGPNSSDRAYSFYLKDTSPDVWFNNFDPNDCHWGLNPDDPQKVGHAYDPQHTTATASHANVPCLRAGHAYDPAHNSETPSHVLAAGAVRPSYNSTEQLRQALVGRIEDISLDSAFFIFVGDPKPLVALTPKPSDGKTYPWSVTTANRDAWLGTWTTTPTVSPADGMQSIIIEATDTLGNSTIVEWSFSKDTQGPVISFDNIGQTAAASAASPRTVSGNAGEVAITGRFNDDYSNIGATFDYRFDTGSGTTMAANWQTATFPETARTPNAATWSVLIPGTFDGTFPDGKHKFQIRARDTLGNLRESEEITFIVDREAPQIPTKADGADVDSRIIIKGTLRGIPSNGYLPERVFSATGVGPADETVKFTLSGVVYEHNLDELNANIRNGTNAVYPTPISLTGINASNVAWNQGGTVRTWFGNGTGNDSKGTNTAGSTFRVKRASVFTATSPAGNTNNNIQTGTRFFTYNNHGLTVGDTVVVDGTIRYVLWVTANDFKLSLNYTWPTDNVVWNPGAGNITVSDGFGLTTANVSNRYVWELDIKGKDFQALLTALPGDGMTRAIAITARDVARRNSSPEVWPFFLDTSPPTIEFSSPTQSSPAAVLEDRGVITLKGTATDATNIQKIQYKIEKKTNHALADSVANAWTSMTGAAPNDFKDYTAYPGSGGTSSSVSWDITDSAALPGDGYYRVTIRASDWSMSSSSVGGNAADAGPMYFYVDRADPVIKWGTETFTVPANANGTNNTNPVGGNVDSRYFTFANHGLMVGDRVQVGSNYRYVLWVGSAAAGGTDTDSFKLSNTDAWPNTAVYNPGAVSITVTANYGTATRTFYRWVNDKIEFDFTVKDLNTFSTSPVASGALYPFNTTTQVAGLAASDPIVVSVASPNAEVSKVNVTITKQTAATIQGRHTLNLDIRDKAGKKASFNQTLTFYLDNSQPVITIEQPASLTEAITGRVEFRGNFKKNTGTGKITRVAFRVTTAALNDANVTVTGVPATDDAWLKANGWFYNDSAQNDPWKLWVGANGAPSNTDTGNGALMEINNGLDKATLLLYDTRRFINVKNTNSGSVLLGTSAQAAAGITFNNTTIRNNTVYDDDMVSPLQLHLLAIDEAGNHKVASFTYQVYPAGDYPKVTEITNPNEAELEAARQLNGTIKIQGKAEDNYRVYNLWFRVLKDGAAVRTINNVTSATANTSDHIQTGSRYFTVTNHGLTVGDRVLVGSDYRYVLWVGNIGTATGNNSFKLSDTDTWPTRTVWNAPAGTLTVRTTGYEPAKLLDQDNPSSGIGATLTGGYGEGWYKAETGGITKNVTWYAQINTNGELEPTGVNTSRRIIIQTLAEDTIWDDSRNDNNGGYTDDGNLYSALKQVSAIVVSGAPTFANEEVKPFASSQPSATTGWGNILTSAVKGLSSYRVTVKHTAAVGSIRWTNAPSAAGVSSTANLLDVAKLGDVNATYGIEVKAEPQLIPAATTTVGAGTYMIWTWGNGGSLSGVGGIPSAHPNPLPDNYLRGIVFTTTAASTSLGTARVLQQVDGNFEWLVTVDIDTTKLDGFTGTSTAGYYNVNLEAHDNSKQAALFSRKTAQIPIDNLPPKGVYTHTTNVAGSNATFGGEAEDDKSKDVHGLSRVVLWFSRDKGSTDGGVQSIVWDEKSYTPSTNAKLTFNNGLIATGTGANSTAITGGIVNIHVGTNRLPAGVTLPNIPNENVAGGINNSCIVIDRQDPLANTAHHGHQLNMGWGAGGALDSSWYVSLDSELIESGRVTAHFIVYDRAGNGTYYNQRLMILNGVPRIDSVTLATDIYGTYSPLDMQQQLQSFTGNSTNLTYGPGAATATFTGSNVSAITNIRNRYTTAGLTVAADPDSAKGIRKIPIDTSKPGNYSVVFDEKDFMVRNNLLAVKVDTLVAQNSTAKKRYYRVEYVSGARQVSGIGNGTDEIRNATTGIIAGRMYLINNPGTNFPWGVLGAQSAPEGIAYRRGLVFLALQNGSELDLQGTGYGTPSVWELNGGYYTTTNAPLTRNNIPTALRFNNNNNDVIYNAATSGGTTAEFVYRQYAFTAGTGNIRDFTPSLDAQGRPNPYDPAAQANASQIPYDAHSLFIIKVFDGAGTAAEAEADLFGDFALLAIRVNNNDVTPPYTQLYDLNPKTEGVEANRTQVQALNPDSIGGNRTKGGLWNTTGSATNVDKSGHIEPRSGTSLTSTEMGGAAAANNASINNPMANTGAYFTVDTVSGDVIVRGYAEDNQRIARVDLEFYNEGNTTLQGNPVTILTRDTSNNAALLQRVSAITARVSFTETVDLDRHRVEWSYLWSSEDLPGANLIVGNINVRAVAYNAHTNVTGAAINQAPPSTGTTPVVEGTHKSRRITRSAIQTPGTGLTARNAFDSFNPGFPAGAIVNNNDNNFYRYNDIRVNIRPYITGFLRDKSAFSHDIRSRQGRYIFRREETPVVTGFNLRNGAGNTTISLSGTTALNAPGNGGNYGITVNQNRHRAFTVPTTATTGTGVVTLSVNGLQAVNTGSERPQDSNRPTAIQPWNIEYNPGKAGSDLWDDFTQVHIWQSNDDNGTGADRGRFPATANWVILNPSMSIDPATGTLYSSHNEGGTGIDTGDSQGAYNTGTVKLGSNSNTAVANMTNAVQFRDPIIMSDVYRSPGGTGAATAETWTTFSVIGRSGTNQGVNMVGGIYVRGPGGTPFNLNGGYNTVNNIFYAAESAWYNASSQSTGTATPAFPGGGNQNPPTTDQFENPHIVTYANGATEHIHVSYYDSKDGSVKYRYNLRGSPNNNLTTALFTTTGNGTDNNIQNGTRYFTYNGHGLQVGSSVIVNNTVRYVVYTSTNNFKLSNTLTWPTDNVVWNPAAGNITVYPTISTATSLYNTGNGGETQAGATIRTSVMDALRQWVNLDGGYDNEDTAGTSRVVNLSGRAATRATFTNVGQHNAIAVTSQGYPVIAYFDMSNQRLKLAVSRTTAPTGTGNWAIRDFVIPSDNLSAFGTGPYVSMKIDTRASGTTPGSIQNTVHIAALNSVTKQLVYVTGVLYPTRGTANTVHDNTTAAANNVLPAANVVVQVVDSVGDVGSWCSLSLDADGNPWISYQDEGYKGAMDGVKVAYKNTTTFTKGSTNNYNGQDIDINGADINGWEAMHVPTRFRVNDARLGMECYPPRNFTGTTATKTWAGAVSYLAPDYYRIAYYVK